MQQPTELGIRIIKLDNPPVDIETYLSASIPRSYFSIPNFQILIIVWSSSSSNVKISCIVELKLFILKNIALDTIIKKYVTINTIL